MTLKYNLLSLHNDVHVLAINMPVSLVNFFPQFVTREITSVAVWLLSCTPRHLWPGDKELASIHREPFFFLFFFCFFFCFFVFLFVFFVCFLLFFFFFFFFFEKISFEGGLP